jgi:hypothetical protein
MYMQRASAFFLILLLGLGGLGGRLYAQEEEEPGSGGEAPIESDWGIYSTELYTRGDQIFIISLGVVFPTLFMREGAVIEHNISPPVGGTGSLAYNYFLNSNFSVGGEVGGMFASTVAQNVMYIIPIGLRLGYQFVVGRFEFPITMTLGGSFHRYLNLGYFGFFMKGGGGVFYRFNPDWSFGVNFNWGWYPQWVGDPKQDIQGNIVDLTVAVRYHF